MNVKHVIIILLLSFSGFGQNTFPFPDTNAYWQINDIAMGVWSVPRNPIGVTGDTMINNMTYVAIGESLDSTFNDSYNTTFYCGVREANDKYFFVQPDDTAEYMLYDFTVTTGDTVYITNPFTIGPTEFQVLSVDSILLLGQYRKRINLDNLYIPGWPESWIEGIGSTFGLPFTGFHVYDAGDELICFHENDTTVYNVSPTGDCYYKTSSLVELNEPHKQLVEIKDLMGRSTDDKPNTLLIHVYSDGTTEKVFRLD